MNVIYTASYNIAEGVVSESCRTWAIFMTTGKFTGCFLLP